MGRPRRTPPELHGGQVVEALLEDRWVRGVFEHHSYDYVNGRPMVLVRIGPIRHAIARSNVRTVGKD